MQDAASALSTAISSGSSTGRRPIWATELPAVTLNSSKPPDAEGGVARPVSLHIEVAGSQFPDRTGSVVPVDRCGLLFGT
jgi:hypothetical protein